jgi:hypothetical protein
MRIESGKVSEKWTEVESLLVEHWQEIAKNKHLMVLSPDVERYALLEREGRTLALFAYEGDALIGYSVSFIAAHLHYSDLVFAQNDVLFVTKRHRKGRAGLSLIRETEASAKRAGCQMIIWHAKQGTALDQLMPRLGYGVQDIMYSREL